MKIKMSITKKLFLITTLVFAVFIGSTLIIQSLFFERFYISKKKSDLRIALESFRTDYNKKLDQEGMSQLINEYQEDYGIKLMIIDKSGTVKFLSEDPRPRPDVIRIREFSEVIRRWIEDSDNRELITKSNKVSIQMMNKRDFGSKDILGVMPNSTRGEVIFAISSLQPVNEAVSVIEELYLYFCVGALFFTILLAFIYSRMIAKPLVGINRVANKLSRLDFSEKCEVGSEDEIGNVASSLNFLSENLDNALGSLKEANAKLEEDIEKERRLEKMRREFVAAVSHELKTPISLIDGYAVGLKDNIFEGKDKDYYLDVIIDEADKMGNLVSDMLDLSYLESGNFKLNREEFNLTELINFTLKKYQALIDEKGAKVEKSLMENLRVNGDWGRLEQVITNFVTNAIRHVNPEGTIFINMFEKGEDVSIEIENTGSSIPEEELEKVWDKFYKTDKSRNRSLGGTGIGLSIVKNILTLHGYEFGAENTDRGVKFFFRVPKM